MKNRQLKRLLSVLLCCMMLFGALNMSVFAEPGGSQGTAMEENQPAASNVSDGADNSNASTETPQVSGNPEENDPSGGGNSGNVDENDNSDENNNSEDNNDSEDNQDSEDDNNSEDNKDSEDDNNSEDNKDSEDDESSEDDRDPEENEDSEDDEEDAEDDEEELEIDEDEYGIDLLFLPSDLPCLIFNVNLSVSGRKLPVTVTFPGLGGKTLKTATTSFLVTDYAGPITLDANGSYTFSSAPYGTLVSFVFLGIPYGSSYTISIPWDEDYERTWSVSGKDAGDAQSTVAQCPATETDPTGVSFTSRISKQANAVSCAEKLIPTRTLRIDKVRGVPEAEEQSISTMSMLGASEEKDDRLFDFDLQLEGNLLNTYKVSFNGGTFDREAFDNGKYSFRLGFGEYIEIVVPVGTEYLVNEIAGDGYTTEWLEGNSGTIGSEDVFLVCENTIIPPPEMGSLVIYKDYPEGNWYTPAGGDFQFAVKLVSENNLQDVYDGYRNEINYEQLPLEDDTLKFKLGFGESMEIVLPYGTQYTVEEIGVEAKPEWEGDTEGTINSSLVKLHCINTPSDEEAVEPTDEDLGVLTIRNMDWEEHQGLKPKQPYSDGSKFMFSVTLSQDGDEPMATALETEYYVRYTDDHDNVSARMIGINARDTLKLELGFHEQVEIYLPYGTSYNVSVAPDSYYTASWDGYTNGMITDEAQSANLICVHKEPMGSLAIGKNGVYPARPLPPPVPIRLPTPVPVELPIGYSLNPNLTEELPDVTSKDRFTFYVELTPPTDDMPLHNFYNVTYYNEENGYVSGVVEVDEDDRLTFELGFNEGVLIELPIGTGFEAREKSHPDYDSRWYAGEDASNPISKPQGTIEDDTTLFYICANRLQRGSLTIGKFEGAPKPEPKPQPTPGPKPEPKSLPSPDEKFEFTVTLTAPEGHEHELEGDTYPVYIYTDGYSYSGYTSYVPIVNGSDGKKQLILELGFDECAEIDLPIGTHYVVSEKEYAAYDASWQDKNGNSIKAEGDITRDQKRVYLYCINTPIPTGILEIGKFAELPQLPQGPPAVDPPVVEPKPDPPVKNPSQGPSVPVASPMNGGWMIMPVPEGVFPPDNETQTYENADAGANAERFEFTVTLTAPQGGALLDAYTLYICPFDDFSSGREETVKVINGAITFSLGFNEVVIIELPVGTGYTVSEKNYAKYDTSWTDITGAAQEPSGTITDANVVALACLNTPATGDLTVSKTVTGDGDRSESFPFTVTLGDASINGDYGDMTFVDGKASFTLKHGESKTAEGLPAGISYTVKETDSKGHTVTSTGATGTITKNTTVTAAFRNNRNAPRPPVPTPEPTETPAPTPEPTPTPEPQFTNVSGQKTWVDNNNADGMRPKSIVVRLMRNGVVIDEKTVTEADGWRYSFTGLPETDEQGNAYVYTVSERMIPGYYTVVEGYDIKNTKIEEPPTPKKYKRPEDRLKELSVEQLEDLVMLFDYGTPLWGGLLPTGDELPMYPFIFGSVGAIALAVYLVLNRKKKTNG